MLLSKLHIANTTFLNAVGIVFCFDFFFFLGGGVNALNPESFHLSFFSFQIEFSIIFQCNPPLAYSL